MFECSRADIMFECSQDPVASRQDCSIKRSTLHKSKNTEKVAHEFASFFFRNPNRDSYALSNEGIHLSKRKSNHMKTNRVISAEIYIVPKN